MTKIDIYSKLRNNLRVSFLRKKVQKLKKNIFWTFQIFVFFYRNLKPTFASPGLVTKE